MALATGVEPRPAWQRAQGSRGQPGRLRRAFKREVHELGRAEAEAIAFLDLPAFAIASQTYSRRQDAHEWLRQASLQAWQVIEHGQENPLADLLAIDANITSFLSPVKVKKLLDANDYFGTAGKRAAEFAQILKKRLDAT